MSAETFPFGAFQANCHVIYNTKDAVIFDPTTNINQVVSFIQNKGLTVQSIALTHIHIDHCLGCSEMSEKFKMIPFVGKEDWDNRSFFLSGEMTFGMDIKPFNAQIILEGEYQWGSLHCKVMKTPGHSKGSISYYFPEIQSVVTGDVLFYRSIGRSDFPGGDQETLFHSIRTKLYSLPNETIVFAGHGPDTTIGQEKRFNAFCQA